MLSLWFEAINDGDIVLLPDADDLAGSIGAGAAAGAPVARLSVSGAG